MAILLVFASYAVALSVALAVAGFRSRPRAARDVPRTRPGRILIVGATGGTGRQLVAQALERGYEVTAFARTPAALELEHARLRVAQGNVVDERTVDAAVRGQDAVVCALGHKRFFYPNRILSTGTRNLVRAMETHGVSRLVCETSLGIGDSAGRMGPYYTLFTIPVVLPFYFWDKTRQERTIASSDLDWVIVRPGVLTHGPARHHPKHGPGVGHWIRTVRVSRADVAEFMLDQVESDAYLCAAPGVCSRPRALAAAANPPQPQSSERS